MCSSRPVGSKVFDSMPQSPRGAKALALCLRLQRPTVMPATGPAGLRAPSERRPHTRSPVSPSRPTSRRTCACRSGRKWWPSHLLSSMGTDRLLQPLRGCTESRAGRRRSAATNVESPGPGGGPHLLEHPRLGAQARSLRNVLDRAPDGVPDGARAGGGVSSWADRSGAKLCQT
jgi:hypothetical protein